MAAAGRRPGAGPTMRRAWQAPRVARRRRTPIGRGNGARARRRRPTGELRGRLDRPLPGRRAWPSFAPGRPRRSPGSCARCAAAGVVDRSAGRATRGLVGGSVPRSATGDRRPDDRPVDRAVTHPARSSRPGRPGVDAGDRRCGRHPGRWRAHAQRGRARCAGRLRRPRHGDDRRRRRHERRRLAGAALRHDAPAGGRRRGRPGERRGRRLARRAPEGDRRDALAVVGGRLGRDAGDRHGGPPASRSPVRTHRHGDGVDVVDGRRRRSARSPPSFRAIARLPSSSSNRPRSAWSPITSVAVHRWPCRPTGPASSSTAPTTTTRRVSSRTPSRRQAAWSMPWSPPTPHSDAS